MFNTFDTLSGLFHVPSDSEPTRPLWALTREAWEAQRPALPPPLAAAARTLRFTGRPGQVVALPGADGTLAGAVLGLGAGDDPWAWCAASAELPPGDWRLESAPPGTDLERVALAWALGRYRFRALPGRSPKEPDDDAPSAPRLCVDALPSRAITEAVAITSVRDLVNTPANLLGPVALEAVARSLADRHGGAISVTVGEELLSARCDLIHAVGRAAHEAPRLLDLTFGKPSHPKVTLVGKGVCFDSGGLNVKPDASMRLMKKDMGGAAHVLGLAHLLLSWQVPIRLRVLIPAVENAISAGAFRPGDVYRSRSGLTVEIGHTDAEGRLVLADALSIADEEAPEVLIDLATLTGAARTALGPDLPPFYTDDEPLAAELSEAGWAHADPMWRLPLWTPYQRRLDSKIADVCHISGSPMAGSITAALFLQRFVERAAAWLHVDLFAWNDSARPGHPVGGHAQAIRALARVLVARYGRGDAPPVTAPRRAARGGARQKKPAAG